jgi:hypothetical protein
MCVCTPRRGGYVRSLATSTRSSLNSQKNTSPSGKRWMGCISRSRSMMEVRAGATLLSRTGVYQSSPTVGMLDLELFKPEVRASAANIRRVVDPAQFEVEVDNEGAGARYSVPAGLAFIAWSQQVTSNLIHSRRSMRFRIRSTQTKAKRRPIPFALYNTPSRWT